MDSSTEKINIDLDEQYAINRAVEIFISGGIFIYPTDTIYGFGGDPFNKSVIDRLNNLKGRDDKKQYIFLINSIDTLLKYSDLSGKILGLLKNIWPAPFTAILNLNTETKHRLNYATAAFRIPDHKFCLNLLNVINTPLISTSVNISNELPLKDGKSILNSEFVNHVAAIFYSSAQIKSSASTLVDLSGKKPIVLREGKINFMELWEKLS